jgi:TRAP-type uncharacterized transport system substrate-binding protein
MNLFENFKFSRRKPNNPFHSFRTGLWIIAIISGVAIYTYIINYVPSERSIFSINWVKKSNLNFYSGSKGGFYIKIGKLLSNKSSLRRFDVSITNVETEGSTDNLQQVMTKKNSLGIAQANDINELRNHSFFKEIGPIYIEKVHVLYNKDNYKIFDDSGKNLIIKEKLDENLKKFLQTDTISAPPVGSGSYLMAELIIDQINGQNKNNPLKLKYESKSTSIEERLQKLQKGDYGVLFFSAGAPLEEVNDLINKKEIGMISISPSFINRLKDQVNFEIISSSFKTDYKKGGNHISTFGTFATLIASNDVENSDILETLKVLDEYKDEYSQLKEIPFYLNYANANKQEKMIKLRSLLIFISSVSASSIAVFFFFLTLISAKQKSKLVMALIEVDKDIKLNQPSLLHGNEELIQTNKAFIKINILYHGILKVDKINFEIKEAYDYGKLTDKTYASLIDQANKLKDEFTILLEKYLLLLNDQELNDNIKNAIKKVLKLGLVNINLYSRFRELYLENSSEEEQ